MAGWSEHPPYHPRRFADTDPASWDPTRRAAVMDSYGIKSQILYPNVAVFDARSIVNMGDPALQLACIQAYNDFLVDFGAEQPGRFIPVAALPFWDLDVTLAEIERCAGIGHKGIVFTQDPGYFGLPELTDRFWDPMWRSAEEKGLPVNFHIASGDLDPFSVGHPDNGPHANYAAMGVSFFMANAKTIAQLDHRRHLPPLPRPQLRVGGERHRLDPVRPRRARLAVAELRRAGRAPRVRPAAERVLPPPDLRVLLVRARHGAHGDRAARRRQRPVRDGLPAPDEHVARPGEHRRAPGRLLRAVFADLPLETTRKILHDNAARIYHLD